ncbi:MAG: hypothetical protein FJ004_05970, partial [Chloroflexi bacterium]|nr:hypothetical protein [Chloroflexota bacterium]
MDKQDATRIIKATFEKPFDKGRFVHFVSNLLNRIDESKAFPEPLRGAYIPESFRDYVRMYDRLGSYTDPEGNKIDLLIVYLQKETSLERARTAQRNFVARYLKDRDAKEAGLVAFVSPHPADWRFSFVKMEYRLEETPQGKTKVREELTPARRYSFLVGESESSHTAKNQLLPILQEDKSNPSLSALEKSFSIEVVTKEFFGKYRELFLDVKEALDGLIETDEVIRRDFSAKGINTVDFSKKLLGQIVFLYFLQKKGWFGVARDAEWGSGSKQFLRELFKEKHGNYKNFFNDVLEPLFYEALRIDRSHDDDYYSRFNCKIPFLNGGLFDPINNYDWVHTDILIPNKLFSNSEKTKEGDTGTGILDVFDRYNFTVWEDEPLEKEVAVDPEMLGKVFEKLGAITPEKFDEWAKGIRSGHKAEENEANRKLGVYYTPREIVHYMCQESLINYLDAAVNTGAAPLRQAGTPQGKLIGERWSAQMALSVPAYQPVVPRQDIETLVRRGELALEHDEIAVKKQAEIEQGKIKSSEYGLKLQSIMENARKIDDALANIRVCDPAVGSGAFLVGMMHEIVKCRSVLTTYLGDKTGRSAYVFKRHAIQSCLYGVDIDPGAVEIAKLRLWLSLVVDEEDISQIKPLPNLDYKIVCGNSLLGYPYQPRGLEEIETLKEQFFDEVHPKEKSQLRIQIDNAIQNLFKNTGKSLGYRVSVDFKVNFSEVFREKGGFDVVIANPPYGLLNKKQNKTEGHIVSPQELNYYRTSKEYIQALGGMINVFRLFIIRSLNILKENGFFTEIFPLAFIGDVSVSKLRKYLISHFNFIGIEAFPERDNEKTRVFESVKMSVCILNMVKKHSDVKFFVRIHHDKFVDFRNEKVFISKPAIEVIDRTNYTIPLLFSKDLNIILKTYRISTRLSEIGHCYTGEVDLTLGRKYLTDNANHATFIKGAIIDRYVIRHEMSQGEIKYLDSKRYLKENHGQKTLHHRVHRIAMQAITGVNEKIRLKMTLINKDIFCANSVNYIIIGDCNIDLRYALALLNSSLVRS